LGRGLKHHPQSPIKSQPQQREALMTTIAEAPRRPKHLFTRRHAIRSAPMDLRQRVPPHPQSTRWRPRNSPTRTGAKPTQTPRPGLSTQDYRSPRAPRCATRRHISRAPAQNEPRSRPSPRKCQCNQMQPNATSHAKRNSPSAQFNAAPISTFIHPPSSFSILVFSSHSALLAHPVINVTIPPARATRTPRAANQHFSGKTKS
jgi:hypothetical protein